jgi:hypothetical protein
MKITPFVRNTPPLPVTLARYLYSNWQLVALAKRVDGPRSPHLVAPLRINSKSEQPNYDGEDRSAGEEIQKKSHKQLPKHVGTNSEGERKGELASMASMRASRIEHWMVAHPGCIPPCFPNSSRRLELDTQC